VSKCLVLAPSLSCSLFPLSHFASNGIQLFFFREFSSNINWTFVAIVSLPSRRSLAAQTRGMFSVSSRALSLQFFVPGSSALVFAYWVFFPSLFTCYVPFVWENTLWNFQLHILFVFTNVFDIRFLKIGIYARVTYRRA